MDTHSLLAPPLSSDYAAVMKTKAIFLAAASAQAVRERGAPLYLSPVAAGFPSPAEDYVEQRLDLHRHLVRNEAATFFLHASGQSMTGAGIHDGDLLVVDRSAEASDGRVVIAAVDGELLVKRLVRKDGRVWLQSENPDYPNFDITGHEHVHIWGVVTYAVHKV